MTVERAELQLAAQFAAAIAFDESQPDDVRDEARSVFDTFNDVLVYGEPGGERPIRLLPLMFRSRCGYYSAMVSETVRGLFGFDEPDGVPAITVVLARQAAEMVENKSYGIDFRIESQRYLEDLLTTLREMADDDRELVDAE
jgi:hypothetical protein